MIIYAALHHERFPVANNSRLLCLTTQCWLMCVSFVCLCSEKRYKKLVPAPLLTPDAERHLSVNTLHREDVAGETFWGSAHVAWKKNANFVSWYHFNVSCQVVKYITLIVITRLLQVRSRWTRIKEIPFYKELERPQTEMITEWKTSSRAKR